MHDRVIVVRLRPDGVVVDYHLEVDDWTLVFVDLAAFSDKVDRGKLGPTEAYEAFGRLYAPVLAGNLTAKLDGKDLTFELVERKQKLVDSVHCDFRFRAPCKLEAHASHEFTFHEGNYELESGLIHLSLADDAGVKYVRKIEPDAALKARPATELKPGDDARLRRAAATFEFTDAPSPALPDLPAEDRKTRSGLAELLDSQQGFWVLLFLAACFGAAHALTPGHGKTLVAAYLVGERGTIGHAFFLGLVTTLTHTGAVIVLAAALPWIVPEHREDEVESTLGLIAGLLVAGLGFWLLLRRLSGRADHFHLHGHGHHHHDHGPADHYHDDHGHAHPLPAATQAVSWWGLIVLGVSGGIVPCWDAILMLGMSARRLSLALPLLLAFSAGLAGVLIVIGIAVVSAKGFARSRWGEQGWLRRVFRALPIVSALAVTGMGLWLCYDSVHR